MEDTGVSGTAQNFKERCRDGRRSENVRNEGICSSKTVSDTLLRGEGRRLYANWKKIYHVGQRTCSFSER